MQDDPIINNLPRENVFAQMQDNPQVIHVCWEKYFIVDLM